MYTKFYGFREKPFTIVSDPGFLYMSSKHSIALNYLEYGLRDGIGFILLTGEIGTGKTTLIKKLVQKIRGEVETAVIFNTNVSAEQLLELILEEYELERPQGGKASYLDSLNQFLINKHAMGERVLLIVDEAQNLSQEALEEIRMLSNLQTDKACLIQIILVGQPGLRARLRHPSLSQLSQRMAVSYHLRPLDLDETQDYITHRLRIAGHEDGGLFSRDAVEKIFAHSGGIPRNINILCDAALVYGYADELEAIDAKIIEKVVQDREDMGSLGPLPVGGTQEVPTPAGANNRDMVERLERLEQLVRGLAASVEGQMRELEGRAESHREVLVDRLESMLKEERKRTDVLLAQCNVLRDRLQLKKTHSESGSKKMVGERKGGVPVDRKTQTGGPDGERGSVRKSLLQRLFGK